MREIGHLGLPRFFLPVYLLVISTVSGQSYPIAEVDSLLNEVIHQTLLQNYEKAGIAGDLLEKHYPDLPFGELYNAAVLIMKSEDYYENINAEKISYLLEKAEEKTKLMLENNNSDPWNNYLMGVIKGYQAYVEVLGDDLLEAFSQGYFSIQYMNRVLTVDSSFVEVFMPIGTYYYWKSAKMESLSWLPFMNDDRDKGIQYLLKSMSADSYNHYLTAHSLIWIYIDRKNFREGAAVAEQILKKYPDNRFFLKNLGRCFQEFDKPNSIRIYKLILQSLRDEGKLNNNNLMTFNIRLADMYYELEDYKNLENVCTEMTNAKLTEEQLEENELRLLKIKKYLDVIEKNNSDSNK